MFKLAGRPAPVDAGRETLAATAPPLAIGTQVAKTITILFSDIKDFTAHSAATPRTGAADLARRHRELARPILQKRRGHIVKTIGDALLVTFDSATDAVLAGLEIQAASRNTAPGETPLNLRIAVATGETIVEAGDVYGETVNLASRLQGIAKPGDVVLSAPTRALVNSREVETELFGEHQLVGFQSPVQVFVARPIATAPTH
jgi:class 3 adenylate cyclase